MNINTQDQPNSPTPSGQEHSCRRCGYPFLNANPSSELRRAHKKVCGTIEGYTKLIVDDSEPVYDSDSGDEELDKTPSPKIEKKAIKESGSSADRFSDAVTELSDAGISPGVVSEVKKVDEKSEVLESSISHSKEADKTEEHDSEPKQSVPNEPHKDKVIDQMRPSDTVQTDEKDQGEDLYELSIKTVQETVQESQTSESVVMEGSKAAESQSLETSKTVPESAVNPSEVEFSGDSAQKTVKESPVMTLGELIAAEMRKTETDHSAQKTVKEPKSAVSDSKESVKDEGSGRNSLEGNWGSVSEVSDVFGKSQVSDDRSRLGRSDAFEGVSSFTESDQETVEQEASKVKAVKVPKSQPTKSEESITKVTNWSTSGHIATTPLRKLMSGDTSSSPKPSSNVSPKVSNPGKSTLTRSPKIIQASSAVKDSGEGEKGKKKPKPKGWARFICCYVPDTK